MQIERSLFNIKTLGPGDRFVIWVNGCKRRCRGCMSKRLQRFNPANEVDIINYLSKFDYKDVDGVTISGGEPFLQDNDLAKLVQYFKNIGIDDILIYSGFTIEELKEMRNTNIDYILNNIAVLIDGVYIDSLNKNVGNLKGSENQRVIFINDKYKKRYLEYENDKRVMQEFYKNNYKLAVGIPTKEYLDNF